MRRAIRALEVCALLAALAVGTLFANGGPFTLKYPGGDPAAKGVLARLHPDLKPQRETRLRVVKEDLGITFTKDRGLGGPDASVPLALVSAEYTIENPTDTDIEIDFGFPILRGIYVNPFSMLPGPDVEVVIEGEQGHMRPTIISNSAIYGIIRQRAREAIDNGVKASPELARLVDAVRESEDADRPDARAALAACLTDKMKWGERDAALMVEYAGLDIDRPMDTFSMFPPTRFDEALHELAQANLGPLAAIGEQKATQLFAQLASRFDPGAAATYEAIFTAWGGDVRERSVDLATGKVRPREILLDSELVSALTAAATDGENPPEISFEDRLMLARDPTVYARVDYLDPLANISEAEKASCKAILKNLPVIFTFAPMNLLHYRATFPANSTRTLVVNYKQYAYKDTGGLESYQLAYVVHPASLWQDFGPINLEVAVPEGVTFRASVECENAAVEEREVRSYGSEKRSFSIYRATLQTKTGELLMAVGSDSWQKAFENPAGNKPASGSQAQVAHK